MEEVKIDFSLVPDIHATLTLKQALTYVACNPDPKNSMIRYRSYGIQTTNNDGTLAVTSPNSIDYCYGIIFPIPVTKLKIDLTHGSNMIEIVNHTSMNLEVSEIKFDPPLIMGKYIKLVVTGQYSRFTNIDELNEHGLTNLLFDVLIMAYHDRKEHIFVCSKYLNDSSVLMKLYFENGYKPCGYVRI